MDSPDLHALYAAIVTCALECDGIENRPEVGIIPRGFYCEVDPANVTVLFISRTPPRATEAECAGYHEAPEGWVQHHLGIQRTLFDSSSGAQASPFHRNLRDWAAGILAVEPTRAAVFARAAFTTLIKCQLPENKRSLPAHTCYQCTTQHLWREIALVRPCLLVALGADVYAYLTSSPVRRHHRLPVEPLYHPGWKNMPGGSDRYLIQEIPRLREAYLRALALQEAAQGWGRRRAPRLDSANRSRG
jgi:hypothetical protein